MLGIWRTWGGKRRESSTPVPPREAPCRDPQGGIARGQRLGKQAGPHCPPRAGCRAGAGHRVALAVRGAFVCAGSWPRQHKVDREDPRPLPRTSLQTRAGGCADSAHRLLRALPGGLRGPAGSSLLGTSRSGAGKGEKRQRFERLGALLGSKAPPEFTDKENEGTLGSPDRPQLGAPLQKQRAPPLSLRAAGVLA